MYPQACFRYADTTCITCVDADNDDYCDDNGLQKITLPDESYHSWSASLELMEPVNLPLHEFSRHIGEGENTPNI